ncbi:MAG: endolytic transglycosylase MltG [Pseudobdellovibrionaceae bacterium]
MKKIFLILISGVVLSLFAFGIFASVLYKNFSNVPPSQEKKSVIFEIPSGKSFSQVATDLQNLGLVKNASLFNLYARIKNQRGQVKVGEYELFTNMTPSQVLRTITSGKSLARPITISEGLNIYDIAALLENKGMGKQSDFFRIVRDPELIQSLLGAEAKTFQIKSLEGYLFPETYMMTKYMGTKELVSQMVKRFLLNWEKIEKKYGYPEMKLSRHERVTLASIIEKETSAPEERKLISSVFHNRLEQGMRLQTDPTILYGLAEVSGRMIMSITKADLSRPNKYNTYTNYGLPPGPIANPGALALEAAFEPEESDYLFFVSQNNGTHIFSENYKDHSAAVQKFQVDPKAREGKSWRDLNKSSAPRK